MMPSLRWTEKELKRNAEVSARLFREARLAPTTAWKEQCERAQKKFESIFETLGDLDSAEIKKGSRIAEAFRNDLGEALRYLAGPPISDDDLRVLADVGSLAPGVLGKNEVAALRVFEVIERAMDSFRFPWVAEKRKPREEERKAAILASTVLLAAQRIATNRRSVSKKEQEAQVKAYLTTLKFREVPPKRINTLVVGPKSNEFCGECLLGDRKADIVVRLHDTRLMPIECKVSNSATNSVKRINNDAAAKADKWLETFGTSQVVPVAMLSGVFNVKNLLQAQERGLTLFWAHDLKKMGRFISGTRS